MSLHADRAQSENLLEARLPELQILPFLNCEACVNQLLHNGIPVFRVDEIERAIENTAFVLGELLQYLFR
jgi:hypothetical protein